MKREGDKKAAELVAAMRELFKKYNVAESSMHISFEDSALHHFIDVSIQGRIMERRIKA